MDARRKVERESWTPVSTGSSMDKTWSNYYIVLMKATFSCSIIAHRNNVFISKMIERGLVSSAIWARPSLVWRKVLDSTETTADATDDSSLSCHGRRWGHSDTLFDSPFRLLCAAARHNTTESKYTQAKLVLSFRNIHPHTSTYKHTHTQIGRKNLNIVANTITESSKAHCVPARIFVCEAKTYGTTAVGKNVEIAWIWW